MPMDFGPVKFSIEGTFTDKPRLLMNGEEVAYDTGAEKVEPASTHLDFSVSAQIGQLEANVSYRVKANDENGLVLAKKMDEKEEKKKDGKKPPFKKNDKKGGDEKSKDGEKPDFKKFKKGKSALGEGTIVIQPAPRSRMGQQLWRDNLAESIADAGE